jgi:hypothetical protein
MFPGSALKTGSDSWLMRDGRPGQTGDFIVYCRMSICASWPCTRVEPESAEELRRGPAYQTA